MSSPGRVPDEGGCQALGCQCPTHRSPAWRDGMRKDGSLSLTVIGLDSERRFGQQTPKTSRGRSENQHFEVQRVRLLVVEDETKVANFIRRGLDEEGYTVDVAADGEEGLNLALSRGHDLVILDINLPKIEGLEVLRRLRESGFSAPVLLLTVRATIEDKVLGLDTGADDYLAKPFAFDELIARVRALLRRRKETKPSTLQVADLTLDPATRTVRRGDENIELTAKEFSLLNHLMQNEGRVLSRTGIAENVWGYYFDTSTNVIDVYINYLRNKIDAGREPKLIHTVRGVGYVLKVE